jgi:rhamnopyranosyl-N-acetylglucosaminyl-diphospho-decaprenol beta-1,3/1,4-galactofuranosyltransferase
MSITDPQKAAFGDERYESIVSKAKDGIIRNRANPFNGVLFSKDLIERVGYPKREMFIWGDEMNYEYRCLNQGYIPVTCIDAVHYHPNNRQVSVKTFFNKSITFCSIARAKGILFPVVSAPWMHQL